MCVMSAVYDHYQPLIPQLAPIPQPTYPGAIFGSPLPVLISQEEADRIRKVIADFREAIEMAAKLDQLMGKVNCEDIEKKRLEERVAALEKQIEAMRGALSPG